MNQLLRQISATVLVTASGTVLAKGVEVDLQMNDDGKVVPYTQFAHPWSDNWYSGIRYRTISIEEENTSEILSRNTTALEEQYKRLDMIGYYSESRSGDFDVSFAIERIDIDRRETGFGEINTGSAIQTDNRVDVNVTRLILAGSYTMKSDFIDLDAEFNLAPVGDLDVDQDTFIQTNGEALVASQTGDGDLGLSYSAKLSGLVKSGYGIDVALNAEYEFLPLEYDLDIVQADLSGFQSVTIDQDQTTSRFSVRILLPAFNEDGRPVLGFSREIIATKEDDKTATDAVNYLVVGFDQRF